MSLNRIASNQNYLEKDSSPTSLFSKSIVSTCRTDELRITEQINLQQQSNNEYSLWSSDLPSAKLERTFSSKEELQLYLDEKKYL
jgi:hypothetical protein